MGFVKTDIKTIEKNVFRMIGDEWALVTAKKDGQVNTMTVSWGGMGVLWGKEVATIYIRPQRYTKEFIDAGEMVTMSFFGGAYKTCRISCYNTIVGYVFCHNASSPDDSILAYLDTRKDNRPCTNKRIVSDRHPSDLAVAQIAFCAGIMGQNSGVGYGDMVANGN